MQWSSTSTANGIAPSRVKDNRACNKIRVLHVAGRKPTIDGEVYWRAMTCFSPACPGEGDGTYPYLFINPHPGSDTFCPACKEIRDPATETTEERNQYRYWARAYVLPQAAERQKQIDAEHRRRLQEARERRRKSDKKQRQDE